MSLPGPRICGWECILADRFCPHGAKIANAKYCDLVCIDPGGLMRGGNVAVLALHFCATSRAKDWDGYDNGCKIIHPVHVELISRSNLLLE
jgi:hypothetical protein